MAKAWIALGANLGDPPAQLRAALDRIRHLPGVTLDATSRFYRSKAIGPAGQADYCNAVCSVSTAWPPAMLLGALQDIERAAGRDRTGPRWGPRILDLDLLLYDRLVLDTPSLKLPHPQMHLRNFVLVPLMELAPELVIPPGRPIGELLASMPDDRPVLWS